MSKTLRLVVCASINKRTEFDKLPVITSLDYDEIIISGDDAVEFPRNAERTAKAMLLVIGLMGLKSKVLFSTRCCELFRLENIMKACDGIIITPRDKNDMAYFKQLNNELLRHHYHFTNYGEKKPIFRLNILPCVRDFLPENLKYWKVRYIDDEKDICFADEEVCRSNIYWVKDEWR